MSTKRHTSTYITEEAIALIRALARHLGISQNAVLELAVREFAEKHNVRLETEERDGGPSTEPD